ncbi:MAG: DUF4344 domain-containing metallopeptidase [Planctomycetota bacterium]
MGLESSGQSGISRRAHRFPAVIAWLVTGICVATVTFAIVEQGHQTASAFPSTGTPVAFDNEVDFASDVVLHVVFHELGHALIREFDLPILGNEETMADAFATHMLTSHFPDRAVDVLSARTKSLMIEAGEVPREEWTVRGEHNNDARRAYQIAALAIAADREKYLPVARIAGLTDDDVRRAGDYGTEIHRSWRRMLQPLWMPQGAESGEARFQFDESNEVIRKVIATGVAAEIESALKRFDWHSQVTIRLAEGDGGAGWSRSSRTITVNSEYIERFLNQGTIAAGG